MTFSADNSRVPTERGVQSPIIIIASNRGPYAFKRKKDGSFEIKRGAGGLVSALGALAEKHDVLWVAAALSKSDRRWAEDHDHRAQDIQGVRLRLITPARKDYEQYYNVIANPLLWFIQHQMWEIPRQPGITEKTWQAWASYQAINKRFATAIAESIQGTDRPVIVLPQDYHLYLVPHYLRQLVGDRVRIQPFIHIPWPGPDAWRILPEAMRSALLTSLLESNCVGFQTQADAFNFVQTCRFYIPDARSRGTRDTIYFHDRQVNARAYPISVDVEKLRETAGQPEVNLIRSQLRQYVGDRKLILRVDRIEPSKNIIRGLHAYRVLLEKHPEFRGNVQMLALLVPSRMEIDQYQDYLKDIMAEAGLINAEFSNELWEPIRIIVGDNFQRGIAAMQLYDVLLVNPIADGMNLVAKEGALVNERNGVIVLSEHAGAFYELGDHALAVSPFDIYGTAQAMVAALKMPAEEREQRAAALQRAVDGSDVKQWFQDQMQNVQGASTHGPNVD